MPLAGALLDSRHFSSDGRLLQEKLASFGSQVVRTASGPALRCSGARTVALNARREEMQAGMRELLTQLDGSRTARVAMPADMTREELEAVRGVEEDD
jgi:hypothetical protein